MLEWREREHETEDLVALQDLHTVASLRNYGLLKFFKTQSMRKELMVLKIMGEEIFKKLCFLMSQKSMSR
jgi:hypothetical protein